MKKILLAFLLSFAIAQVAFGQIISPIPTRIDPVDDGSIYLGTPPSPNFFSRWGYLLTQNTARGAMLFRAFDASNLSVSLQLNPYGLPLWDLSVDVYGYNSTIGLIQAGDYNKGAFLGTLNILPSIGFGQESLLDVTSFARESHPGGYMGFLLVTDQMDIFSSLEYNYRDHPSGIVTTPVAAPHASSAVPEPSTYSAVAGIVLLGIVALKQRRKLVS
jgi:hypothetical protein